MATSPSLESSTTEPARKVEERRLASFAAVQHGQQRIIGLSVLFLGVFDPAAEVTTCGRSLFSRLYDMSRRLGKHLLGFLGGTSWSFNLYVSTKWLWRAGDKPKRLVESTVDTDELSQKEASLIWTPWGMGVRVPARERVHDSRQGW